MLTQASAADKNHRQIAQLALAQMPADLKNPEWWAQGVAVAFEQAIGRRVPGQAQDSSFQGAISTTLDTTLDNALERWLDAVSQVSVFNGQQMIGEPSTSSSERWRYWRAGFSDGTKTQVNIGLKGEKVAIAINITKAKTEQTVSEWKVFWRQILALTKG